MRSHFSTTAVLLFALPEGTEAARKPVAARQSARVWRAMRALTQAKVRASGLPLLHSGQLIAHRGTFGEQLAAALGAGFARGYERIICISNDCPELSVLDLRRAAEAFADDRVPLGADRRGGLYLIGFHRDAFDASALAQLPWQTATLAQAVRGYWVDRKFTYTELPVRADLNQRPDATAIRWAGQAGCRWLTVIREALRLAARPPVSPAFLPTASAVPTGTSGRAPPRRLR